MFLSHNIETLISVADLKDKKEEELKSVDFAGYYGTVKDWNESRRYDIEISASQARHLLEAITDEKSGVLTWLKSIW